VVINAAIVRAGDGAQFGAPVRDFHRLDLFGAMVCQAVLQIDPRERCRELAQIGRWRADQARKLAEAPMRGRNRCVGVRQDERQFLRVVAMGFDPDRRALDRARPAALGAAFHRGVELRKGEVLLVIGPGKPFG